MQRPPPLHLLTAFEAAARLMSFSKGAKELHVTTAAISQQIKQLETHLGLKLFHRLTRSVSLTEAGQDFARLATQTLNHYRQGHAELMHRHTRPVLRLSTSPFVAHKLLIPSLSTFQAAHPDVDLRLVSSMDYADFDQAPIDAAIRIGSGPWPGLESWPLCTCFATIIASKALLDRAPAKDLEDLKHHVLIHPRATHLDWQAVADFARVPRLPNKGELMLDSDLAAWHSAVQGLGVTICILPQALAPTLLGHDGLIDAFPLFKVPFEAHFVFRPDSGKEALLRSAFEWIQVHLSPPINEAASAGITLSQ